MLQEHPKWRNQSLKRLSWFHTEKNLVQHNPFAKSSSSQIVLDLVGIAKLDDLREPALRSLAICEFF